MNEQPTPPSAPPPPPKLNAKILWLTILGPIALIGMFTIIAFSEIEFDFMSVAPTLTVLAILVGWITFGIALSKRFRGVGLVLCIIGYPLAQTAICFAIFFFGCLASLDGNWGHRPPDSWVQEQERLARENPIDPSELEEAKEALEQHLEDQKNRPTTEPVPSTNEVTGETDQ